MDSLRREAEGHQKGRAAMKAASVTTISIQFLVAFLLLFTRVSAQGAGAGAGAGNVGGQVVSTSPAPSDAPTASFNSSAPSRSKTDSPRKTPVSFSPTTKTDAPASTATVSPEPTSTSSPVPSGTSLPTSSSTPPLLSSSTEPSVAPTSTTEPTSGLSSSMTPSSTGPTDATEKPAVETTSSTPSTSPSSTPAPSNIDLTNFTLTNLTLPNATTVANDTYMPGGPFFEFYSPSIQPSYAESRNPSMAPSFPRGSIVPSSTPSATTHPSLTPVVLLYSTNDTFSVKLISVGAVLDDDSKENYRNQSQLFLGELLGLLETPVTNVAVQVIGQTLLSSRRHRRLQSLFPIQIDMYVQGDTLAENITLAALCRQFYDVQGSVFLQMLASTKDPDFAFATRVESVDVTLVGVPTSAPTPLSTLRTAAPSVPPADGGGLGLAIIVGIAAGGGVLLLILVWVVFKMKRKGGAPNASTTSGTKDKPIAQSVKSPTQSMPPKAMNSMVSEGQSMSDNNTLYGNDNMSYAYSLDHGIGDQNSVGGYGDESTVGRSTVANDGQYHGRGGRMPMEIPNMSGSDLSGGRRAQAMENKITRECFAPPGKLGIVIDTTMQGPVVHKVNAGSPLEGVVWPGDIIVAIDDVDTRAMSASAITTLMAQSMNKRRRLTVMSDDK